MIIKKGISIQLSCEKGVWIKLDGLMKYSNNNNVLLFELHSSYPLETYNYLLDYFITRESIKIKSTINNEVVITPCFINQLGISDGITNLHIGFMFIGE